MRLLLRSSSGEFSLTKDLVGDDPIPPYAILSHTWGADAEEVTFEDLTNGTGKDKPGYEKIRFCGEQARQDDLQYFWVDTCCINKANYTELSQAINSMFRWYRNATRCYVYLSDVSSPAFDTNEAFNPRPWEPDFRKSRWFERGWTLQELLAPSSVEFFSQERKRLGDKRSLEQQIHEITGITDSALRGAPLSQFSVDKRLSWIERRQTKLEEDTTYSLLGIFDVHIPLIYGEGRESAFKRLREEIDKPLKGLLQQQALVQMEKEDKECVQHLRLTDPRLDKARIEETKGGLLQDSYHWILEHPDFQQWRNDQQSRLLWIKGDPGKGKTMLLCGIIDELVKTVSDNGSLSFFFCEATDSRINNATAVLRGLIYLLVDEQPSLISHIRKKYDRTGKALFEDVNTWVAFCEILTNILQDPSLKSTYLIIDALDECQTDRSKLLKFIVQKSSTCPRAKWIVSSRNWPSIEKQLEIAEQNVRLCLELNADSVSGAVITYIHREVRRLAQLQKYDLKTESTVRDCLLSNANDTFLWVALVCQELEKIPRRKTLAKLNAFPPELDSLYERMMDHICTMEDIEDVNLCKQILASVRSVYRPITLKELTSLVDGLEDYSDDLKSLGEIIGLCGSFLTIRENTVYFVHQSAKEFLLRGTSDKIFSSTVEEVHRAIFSRSLEVMSRTLRRDIYELRAPGFPIDQVRPPDRDPLAAVHYSCVYWIDHLCDAKGQSSDYRDELADNGRISTFFKNHFLHWLESLSLLRKVSGGTWSIRRLSDDMVDASKSPRLYAFIHDAKRFLLYNRSVIEEAPLQTYCSALIFAPEDSVVRKQFENDIPTWICKKPTVQAKWNATLQTLEGHSNSVRSVAFSPDGKLVASGSDDNTVRLWDAGTGAALQTLKGHSDSVRSVAFLPDGKLVASGSDDHTVRLWEAGTGAAPQTLEGHSNWVSSVAFSPDGKLVVSSSFDHTVRLWDAGMGAALQTLKGHSNSVSLVAFSPNGKLVALGSDDNTVRLWEAGTGAAPQTLEGHSDWVSSVAFSPDGKLMASGSDDHTVRLWEAGTGAALQTLEGHSNWVSSVAFSPDGKLVASGSHDHTVRLWDAGTGAALQTLEGHSNSVWSVAFSPDGKLVVSGSLDHTVRLWDAGTGAALQTLKGHSNSVSSVVFSPDGKLVASGSDDNTVRLWDAGTGAALHTLEGHSYTVCSVAFSSDGKLVASGSNDHTVRLWDAGTGAALQILDLGEYWM